MREGDVAATEKEGVTATELGRERVFLTTY
jgi:hypothetical protein